MKSAVLDAMADRALELGPKPSGSSPWAHWRLTKDEDGVAWLLLDKKDSSANTLAEAVLLELNAILEQIEKDLPRALVVRSAKLSGFIAGADINEFRSMTDATLVEVQITKGHAVLDRLEALRIPTVAVIHGFCLGGGLEVALACKRRIAIEGARFGFPEVLLGLHPGLGGTARSVHLVDPLQAMSLMLTGRTLDARRTKTLGLVDVVTEERHVRNAVKDAAAGELRFAKPSWKVKVFNWTPVRRFLAGRMRSETAKKALREHYPAPYALIDLWEKYGDDRALMLTEERRSFAQQMVTSTAQNLIRVFFLRENMKKLAGGKTDIEHVHVIGAGAMGGDIAAWCAYRGFRATLADMKSEPIAGAVKRAADLYGKLTRKKIDVRDALDRLIPDLTGEGVAQADLIIEAVPEKLDLKQKVYAALEQTMKESAILATNTSSIPLEDLRAKLIRPDRLVGVHFFNPVSRMQLVEVVSHDLASSDALAKVRAFVGQIDRLPLPVKSAPGFLVNRALTPYMLEAMILLDEKVPKETIDEAAKRFGMPMGPIELADTVGLDICLAVADSLRAKLDQRMPEAPDWLRKKVADGELGKKTGKGFYVWRDGEPVKGSVTTQPNPEITDRLILPMLNVCVACLREGIVTDEEVTDGAMIFGTGFAPFRGGPLHYARARGGDEIVLTLQRLEDKYGPRFVPDAGWDRFTTRK